MKTKDLAIIIELYCNYSAINKLLFDTNEPDHCLWADFNKLFEIIFHNMGTYYINLVQKYDNVSILLDLINNPLLTPYEKAVEVSRLI